MSNYPDLPIVTDESGFEYAEGMNLWKGSGTETFDGALGTWSRELKDDTSVPSGKYARCTLSAKSAQFPQWGVYGVGTKYREYFVKNAPMTLSLYARASREISFSMRVEFAGKGIPISLTTQWQKIEASVVCIRTPEDSSSIAVCFYSPNWNVGDYIDISSPMLAYGKKFHPYRPNPTDLPGGGTSPMAVVARGISLTVKHRTAVGGRNLLKQSMVKCYANGTNESLDTSQYPATGHITYNRDTSANLGFYIDNKTVMIPGEQYIVTARIKCTSGTITRLCVYDGITNGASVTDQKSSLCWNHSLVGAVHSTYAIPTMTVGTWYDFRFEFTCPTLPATPTQYDGHILQINKDVNQAFAIEIDGLKFEHGNTPTDWTPAPEDKANQAIIDKWSSQSETDVLSAVQNGFTTINGGFIQTSTIKADHLYIDKDLRSTVIEAINISAQEINAPRINADALDVRGMTVHNAQNVETLRVTSEGDITIRGDMESYNFKDGKTGWSIKRNGNAEFNDVLVRGSVVTNDGGIASSGGAGRNLMRYTAVSETNKSKWQTSFLSSFTVETFEGRTCYKLVANSGTDTNRGINGSSGAISGQLALQPGKKYTFSFWAWSSIAGNFSHGTFGHIQCRNSDNSNVHCDINHVYSPSSIPANTWTYCTVTFEVNAASTFVPYFWYMSANKVLRLAEFKLEEGTVATSWSPAPEDNFKQVRFWAGASYEERENAPFIVYNDGSIKATKGNYSGLWTGDIQVGNISISDTSATAGNDALLKIQHGSNGVVAVELTDKDESIFRQDLSIRNSTNVEMISLSREGSGIFNSQVQVGTGTNASQLQSDRLNLRGHTLGIYSAGFQFESPVNVGSATNTIGLTSYGAIGAKSDINLDGSLMFGAKVIFARVSDGLNIDVL